MRGLVTIAFAALCVVGAASARVSGLARHDAADTGRAHLRGAVSAETGLRAPKMSGYLPVQQGSSESLFFAFWEAQERHGEDQGDAPIILWLQGGPGCASTFGLFYEIGPVQLSDDLEPSPRPGTWNQQAALLIIDQPLGTGLSFTSSNDSIPTDEIEMAEHLYHVLQTFFDRYWFLRDRPLFIAGESYGGKYVPSLAHAILQASIPPHANADGDGSDRPALRYRRDLPASVTHWPPLFRLAGVAVGNGLTAPRKQTLTLAARAWSAGLVSSATRAVLEQHAEQVVSLIDEEMWGDAHRVREELRSLIVNVTGLATMFDTRRTVDYDPTRAVDRFLNLPDVREFLGASRKGVYASCNDVVRAIMGADVMQSVAHLVPDLLNHIHVLLYQGNYDILDGPISNAAWIETLEDWELLPELLKQPSELWYYSGEAPPGPVRAGAGAAAASTSGSEGSGGGSGASSSRRALAGGRGAPRAGESHVGGWQRSAGRLTHAVVFKAGHMAPHDQPLAVNHMLFSWIWSVLDEF